MSIVLQTQLLLDPGNQIAHLVDFTSLVVETEYLISAPFLQADTRFVFLGYFDIALTRPPLNVPMVQTEVPATISTVPMPAAATPPARYPYALNDRMLASNLNLAFDMDPGGAPPIGNGGGAGRFRYWVDTSTTLPTLRQCVANPHAQAGVYVAGEWVTIGTIDAAAHKFHFDMTGVDFGGGSGGSITLTNLTVNNITIPPGGSIIIGQGGNIQVAGPINVSGPDGGFTFYDRVLDTNHWWEWYASGDVACLFNSPTNSNRITISSVGDLGVNRNINAGGTISGQTLSSTGNITATADVTARDVVATRNIWASSGTVTAAQLTSTSNINASGTITAGLDVSVGHNIGVQGTVYAAGADCTGRINAAYYDCDGVRVLDTGGGDTFLYKSGGVLGIQLQNAATYYDNNSHIFRNSGGSNAFVIDSAGTVNATALVQGASLYSRGNIDAAANISANGTLYAASDISTGGVFSGARLQGGPGGAGQLRTYNTVNSINFRWGTAATGQLSYRVDESVEKFIGSTVNVWDTQYYYPGGGPTGGVFSGHDTPGTWYYSYIDYTSDERIKSNIVPTTVDALSVLKQVPVDEYDVSAQVVDMFRSLNRSDGQASAREDRPESAHVPIGLVAQKLQALIPEAVYIGQQPAGGPLPEDCHNITLPAITPYLIRAVQQLVARLEALEGAA